MLLPCLLNNASASRRCRGRRTVPGTRTARPTSTSMTGPSTRPRSFRNLGCRRPSPDHNVLGRHRHVDRGGVRVEDGDGAVLDGFGVGTQDSLPHADEAEAVAAGARGQFCFGEYRLRFGKFTVRNKTMGICINIRTQRSHPEANNSYDVQFNTTMSSSTNPEQTYHPATSTAACP